VSGHASWRAETRSSTGFARPVGRRAFSERRGSKRPLPVRCYLVSFFRMRRTSIYVMAETAEMNPKNMIKSVMWPRL
jgi:hypothetical protein